MDFLNKLESFAIPFAAGAADDAIGFQETAAAFLTTMDRFMAAIYYLRQTQGARYASALKLFSIWHARAVAQALGPAMLALQGMVNAGAQNQIPPV